MPRLVDLPHAISPGMVTCPGLPSPALSDLLTFEDSPGWPHAHRLETMSECLPPLAASFQVAHLRDAGH